MPAKIDIDRNQVRMLVQDIDVRETARQLGLNEETVAAWSARGKWLESLPRNIPLPPSMVQAPASSASNVPETREQIIKQKLLRTRMNHADTALVASEQMLEVATLTPKALLDPEVAGVLLTHGKHASMVGGWQNQPATSKVALQVTGAHLIEQQEQTIDAEWDDAEPVTTQD